jgi:hypothetical protein
MSGLNSTMTQATYGENISNSHTGTASTNYGLYANAFAGNSNTGVVGASMNNNSNVTINLLQGAEGLAENLATTTTVSNITGIQAGAYNEYASTIGEIDGYYGWAESDLGTTTTLNGALIDTWNGGTTGEMAGLRIRTGSWAGTVTDRYGILIEAPPGWDTGVTNDWGIYEASTKANYFAGSIGIGIANPLSSLEISGTAGSYGQFLIVNGSNKLGFWTDSTGDYLYANGVPIILKASNNTSALTVDTSGNVGIGTTSPGATLEVNGTLAEIPFTLRAPTAWRWGTPPPPRARKARRLDIIISPRAANA